MAWGNLVFAGLVISQAIAGTLFNVRLALIGVACLLGAYLFAARVMKGGDD